MSIQQTDYDDDMKCLICKRVITAEEESIVYTDIGFIHKDWKNCIDHTEHFPRNGILKCDLCKREIVVAITSLDGLIKFEKFAIIHDNYEKQLSYPCGGIIRPKNIKIQKSDKQKEDGKDIHNGKDIRKIKSDITFDKLIVRNVIVYTREILENYLVFFPKHNFKIDISGIILYGPNGTGKTEFCNALMNDKEFSDRCDFMTVDVYNLIDHEMGATSENVEKKFINWEKKYKDTGKPQIIIIDEGELVFLHRKDKSSKAYTELCNSMLKHTGSFNGVFIIIITNNINSLDSGAISRFDKIYWPSLDNDEKILFMKSKLENSEIKFVMDDFNKIIPLMEHDHYGDIRMYSKLMTRIKGWYVRKCEIGSVVNVGELTTIINEFNKLLQNNKDNDNNGQNLSGRQRIGEPITEIRPIKELLDKAYGSDMIP